MQPAVASAAAAAVAPRIYRLYLTHYPAAHFDPHIALRPGTVLEVHNAEPAMLRGRLLGASPRSRPHHPLAPARAPESGLLNHRWAWQGWPAR
eukprot:SAG11_NODE_8984_length_956_cov_1.365228_2_plen_92_part_01